MSEFFSSLPRNGYHTDLVRLPTPRQLAVLCFIWTFLRDQGVPPTLREIGSGLGLSSTNGVNDHLKALEGRGLIERKSSMWRGLFITEAGFDLLKVKRPEHAIAEARAVLRVA